MFKLTRKQVKGNSINTVLKLEAVKIVTSKGTL